MNRKQKIIISVTGIFLVLLILVGLTYAYFLTQIQGNENDKSITVTTANLLLVYEDGNGVLEPAEMLMPGNQVKFLDSNDNIVESKTFTVTNRGNVTIESYAVIIQDLIVKYASTVSETIMEGATTSLAYPDDFRITLTCESNLGNPCLGVSEEEDLTLKDIGSPLVTNSIEADETHTYTISLYYKNTDYDQSLDMNKAFSMKMNIANNLETSSLSFVVPNSNESDYAELHSVKQTNSGYYDSKTKTKTYTFVGVEPETHTITIKSKDGSQILQKQIAIENGNSFSTNTENGLSTITVGNEKSITVPISSSGEFDLNNITKTINKSELNGVTVNVLTESEGETSVDGLKLFTSMDEAYNALQEYLGVGMKNGVLFYDKTKVPRKIVWTFYGNVTFNKSNAVCPYGEGASCEEYSILTGGLNIVWLTSGPTGLTNTSPIEEIIVQGGNSSANFTNTLTENFTFAYNNYDGNTYEIPMNVKINNLKFNKTFTFKHWGNANVTFEGCKFTKQAIVQINGNVNIKNNKFEFEDSFIEQYPNYYAMIFWEVDKPQVITFENNIVNNTSRGISIGAYTADLYIKNNKFTNLKTTNAGAIQLTGAKSVTIDNNIFDNIVGNALYFYHTYPNYNTLINITNNTITNTAYLAQLGDDNNVLNSSSLNITSSGNSVNVKNVGKGISEQGTVSSNTFTLN